MTNYPVYLGLMAAMATILYLILRFISKKFIFLKNGFRTKATVVEVVEHHAGRMIEFGYVPIIKFKSRTGQILVVKTSFFLERFITNPKLEVGYEFDIIYEKDDIKNLMEYSTLKGVVVTYSVVALFPGIIFLGLLVGLFY